MTDTISCHKCTMSFHVGEPSSHGNTKPETTTCAEDKCSRVFWHCGSAPNHVAIGMYPADAKAYMEDVG